MDYDVDCELDEETMSTLMAIAASESSTEAMRHAGFDNAAFARCKYDAPPEVQKELVLLLKSALPEPDSSNLLDMLWYVRRDINGFRTVVEDLVRTTEQALLSHDPQGVKLYGSTRDLLTRSPVNFFSTFMIHAGVSTLSPEIWARLEDMIDGDRDRESDLCTRLDKAINLRATKGSSAIALQPRQSFDFESEETYRLGINLAAIVGSGVEAALPPASFGFGVSHYRCLDVFLPVEQELPETTLALLTETTKTWADGLRAISGRPIKIQSRVRDGSLLFSYSWEGKGESPTIEPPDRSNVALHPLAKALIETS